MKRPIATVRVTSHFTRQYKRLLPEVKEIAEGREQIFRADAFDPRLRTRKLSGRLKDLWAISVTHDLGLSSSSWAPTRSCSIASVPTRFFTSSLGGQAVTASRTFAQSPRRKWTAATA